MAEYNYCIVNVFAEKRLAVLEGARGINAVTAHTPSHLRLSVDEAGSIIVAGRVIGLGSVSI